MQETVPRIIEHYSKFWLEGSQHHQKLDLEAFLGDLGALGFMNAEKCAMTINSGAIWAPLGRICVPFWRPLDFEGPIRSVFLDVFVATATN